MILHMYAAFWKQTASLLNGQLEERSIRTLHANTTIHALAYSTPSKFCAIKQQLSASQHS
jgi:hypothetical protein